ncbi:MAG: LysR family transcriptional regulator, partial [Chloroflexi bacterium]|nr:LysR family transcriptional regulator [Chloroflexota bacterium]
MYELDLHRLNVFYTVVNEGTLSKAGERLFMSQPAISAHIKALEQQLGVRLFDRIGRRSVVNKAGELLYKKAEELFTVADDLKACMEDLRGVSNGRLTIGVSMDWQYRLPRALGRFKQEYPGVELSMEIGDSDRIEKMVMERSLDVGFVVNESSRAELASEHVAADELVPICSANHRLAGRKKLAVS